jgi:hypothetical protein
VSEFGLGDVIGVSLMQIEGDYHKAVVAFFAPTGFTVRAFFPEVSL